MIAIDEKTTTQPYELADFDLDGKRWNIVLVIKCTFDYEYCEDGELTAIEILEIESETIHEAFLMGELSPNRIKQEFEDHIDSIIDLVLENIDCEVSERLELFQPWTGK